MFDLFDFDLPGAVTEHLLRQLKALQSSPLKAEALHKLGDFQARHRLNQGVYELLLDADTMYVGKANHAKERLEQHWDKLRGRRNLDMGRVHFKCLLPPNNWSPSANEKLLISHYKQHELCKWNGQGVRTEGCR